MRNNPNFTLTEALNLDENPSNMRSPNFKTQITWNFKMKDMQKYVNQRKNVYMFESQQLHKYLSVNRSTIIKTPISSPQNLQK